MSLYSIALFVHVVGAVLLFVLLTVEGIGIRSGTAGAQLGRVLGPITAALILVAGFYMAAQTGWHAWTAVGLVSYLAIAGLGAYTGISFGRGRISRSAATLSWLIRIGIALGVLFDMTVKPDAIPAVVAVVVAAALGGLCAIPTGRLARVQ